jgi:hypothetical protein
MKVHIPHFLCLRQTHLSSPSTGRGFQVRILINRRLRMGFLHRGGRGRKFLDSASRLWGNGPGFWGGRRRGFGTCRRCFLLTGRDLRLRGRRGFFRTGRSHGATETEHHQTQTDSDKTDLPPKSCSHNHKTPFNFFSRFMAISFWGLILAARSRLSMLCFFFPCFS